MGKKVEGSQRSNPARGRTAPRKQEPLSRAGAKIVAAFEEAIVAMRPGSTVEPPLTVRTYQVDFTPRMYGPEDVRRVRELLGMSQALFARFLGVDPNTVRSWEQGNRPPSPIARRFMEEVEADPAYWRGKNARRAVVAEVSDPHA